MSFGICDLETENNPHLGHLSSPHCEQNYIVAPGWAINDGPVGHCYFNSRAEADASLWFDEFIKDVTILVAHNATFEIHWLLGRHKDAFLAFIKRGGKVFCTQYAEYLLTHQVDQYPSLEDTAVKYGGTKKIDEVKILWEQGVKTSEIDPELLIRYLAGPEGDIENTRIACFNQYRLLEERGMLQMFWLRMDSLVFNAVSTFHGLYVDMEVAARNHKLQLERADVIRQQIKAMLPADLPTEFEFNFGSGYHMSAFLFGGPIKYDKRVPYDPPKFEKVDAYEIAGAGHTRYVPVDQVLPADLHWVTIYKSGKNKGMPKVFPIDSDVPKLKWGDDVYNFKGLVDFADLPSHVSSQYLDKRAEFRGKQTLSDGVTPVYSTGKDSLDLLANFVAFAKPLKELAQLDKDNSTYYLVQEYNAKGEPKKTKGMLQYVGPDGIIHHSLNGCATVTTRLSSSTPNLQNLPREGTSTVKEMFSSRFGKDGRIVEVDYTALEVVDIAAASGDRNLLDRLLSGTDMHCYRLAGKHNNYQGCNYDELVAIVDNKEHPLHKAIKEARTQIKPKAFAAQYGASAHGISFATGCSIEEAQEFLDNEAALFPEATAFKQLIRKEVEITGSLPEGLHRECTDEGMWSIYRRGYYRAPGGTCYSFRQYATRKNGQQTMDYKDTQISNYPIQGESSFIVQSACGRVLRWLVANDFFGGAVLCINTVHDAIYLDCINEEWARYVGKYVAWLMADTPRYMCELIPAYKEWGYDTTPFPAVPEFGLNMMSKEHC